MVDHIGTQELRTRRLLLRKFRKGDAEMMYRNYTSDPEVTRYLTWPPHASVEVTGQFLDYVLGQYAAENGYSWAIVYEGEVVGSISVVNMSLDDECCEVGYCLSRSLWDRGIMTEALKAVLGFLLDTARFNCVSAYHDEANPASGRVMQKAGMSRDGVLRARKKYADGTHHDFVYYSILNSEYREKMSEYFV
jgi:ribosomal-protein-alanine N-acetyltransferase